MSKRNWLKISGWLLILSVIGQLITPVVSETSSFRNTAAVLPVDLWSGSSAKELLIDANYKAFVVTYGTTGVYGDYSKWFAIDQGTSKTVVIVAITNIVNTLNV